MLIFTDILLSILIGLIALLIREFIKHKQTSIQQKIKSEHRITALETAVQNLSDIIKRRYK